MTSERTRAYCRKCRHEQVFERVRVRHWLHMLFSVATLGVWMVSWIAMCVGRRIRPWRCKHCGWHTSEVGREQSRDGHYPKDAAEA